MSQPQLDLSLPDACRQQPGAVRRRPRADANRLAPEDYAFHDWYRFVLSYPPHLVRAYLADFGLTDRHTVLDPFCGTGTTLVEAKLSGVPSIGIEANPLAHFASTVKVDWAVSPEALATGAAEVAAGAQEELSRQGIDDDLCFSGPPPGLALRQLPAEEAALLLAASISPLPLHKVLVLRDHLNRHAGDAWYQPARLALAKVLVFTASNLRFGPEVGVGVKKEDAPVVSSWLAVVRRMVADLRTRAGKLHPSAEVRLADARQVANVLPPQSVDAVFTSPPYPNEKDYTRTTRLESVLLGFITSKAELRALKRTLVRSNTRGVYKGDDDARWIAEDPEIRRLAEAIEQRRLELGKNSGFERLYARVTMLYFGGMARHLAELRAVLRPGARLAYVVGDQASYLRVMIRTGALLGRIATRLGYEVVRIDLFRTRFATGTREQLREEVVVLRWPGRAGRAIAQPDGQGRLRLGCVRQSVSVRVSPCGGSAMD